jgi:hypothetical protein
LEKKLATPEDRIFAGETIHTLLSSIMLHGVSAYSLCQLVTLYESGVVAPSNFGLQMMTSMFMSKIQIHHDLRDFKLPPPPQITAKP